jgi:single-strand DNA-binding protein
MGLNINRVILTGNLTTSPELRFTPNGIPVCRLRVASTTRRKDPTCERWVDKPNYFDVTVWGSQAQSAKRLLTRGRPIAIDGRLEWHAWEAADGTKHQRVEIVADVIQYLSWPPKEEDAQEPTTSDGAQPAPEETQAAQTAQEAPAAA